MSDQAQIIQKPGRSYWAWVILLVIIVCACLVRARLVSVPFDRDEGEYAYAGQLILDGVAPYGAVYNMKLPGIYAAYAAIMAVGGESRVAVHVGLLVVNAVTILLLFLLWRRIFDAFVGLCAAGGFAVLSLGQKIQGISANAEHFVIVFAIGGIYLLFRAVEEKKRLLLALGAVSLGTCFLMKQHGIMFIVFGLLYLIFSDIRQWKEAAFNVSIYLCGVLLPYGITCLILWRVGVFEKFWFWTFEYASKYVSSSPLNISWVMFKKSAGAITGSAILIWIAAGVGFIVLLFNKKIRGRRGFVSWFCVFSFLAICPGLYFRAHYFILLTPAVGLLAGIAMASIRDACTLSKDGIVKTVIPIIAVLAILLGAGYQQREFLFEMTPQEASYLTYGGNPFCESLEIARYVKENSSKDDRIAVIGSEPQIFFYADRRSATGYIYTYPLMELHEYVPMMQDEILSEVKSAKPKFLIIIKIWTSWMMMEGSDLSILERFGEYEREHYRLTGIVDMISLGQTVYRWDGEIEGYSLQSKNFVLVYERKD